jgi:hypothetical protein
MTSKHWSEELTDEQLEFCKNNRVPNDLLTDGEYEILSKIEDHVQWWEVCAHDWCDGAHLGGRISTLSYPATPSRVRFYRGEK